MAPLDRSEKFQIRLTEDEKRMLEAVADHDGLSASDMIRQFIRQRFAATFPTLHATTQAVEKMVAPVRALKRPAPRVVSDTIKKQEAASKALKRLARSSEKKR